MEAVGSFEELFRRDVDLQDALFNGSDQFSSDTVKKNAEMLSLKTRRQSQSTVSVRNRRISTASRASVDEVTHTCMHQKVAIFSFFF